MELSIWKVTTVISAVALLFSVINNPVITGAFVLSKPTLELFVMSQCPYGITAEQMMYYVLDAFGDSINFKLNFIAAYSNGVFQSLHGQAEVNENLRQVCAMKYYPDDYFNYVLCYGYEYSLCSQDYSDCVNSGGSDCSSLYSNCIQTIDWASCATEVGINPSVIMDCYLGVEGEQLLVNNIKRADELGVTGSETFFLDGVELERTYRWNPDAIKEIICESNPSLSACSLTLSSGSSGSSSGSC